MTDVTAHIRPNTGNSHRAAPSRLPLLLVHAIAFGTTFALAKILCMCVVGADWHTLPWLIGPDFLVGCVLATAVLLNHRLARLLMDVCLILYVVNIHYASLFGGFIDIGVLSFASELHHMTDSMAAVLDWRVLAALPLLVVLHRVLVWFLWNKLHGVVSHARPRTLLTYVLVVVAFSAPAGLFSQREFHTNPLSRFVASALTAMIDAHATSLDPIEKGDLLPFDCHSPFAARSFQPPVFRQAPGRQFNVVLLLLESTSNPSRQRADGDPMPHFTSLTRRGVYWPNFYCNTPMSIKTIFATHSGHYPAADFVIITDARPRFPSKALPAFFKEHGYRTALLHGGYFEYTKKRRYLVDRGYDVLYDGKTIPGGEAFKRNKWGVDDKAVFDYAAQWICESDQPFFLTIIPILPHHPYHTPERWKKRFAENTEIDQYHNSLFFEDQLLGSLITNLKAAGRFEDTIFVVTADHGEAFSQHGRNRVHSAEIFEENMNVPLVISNPILFGGPQQSPILGAHIDLLPTLCDLVGFDMDDFYGDGVSLFRKTGREMVFFYTELRGQKLGLRDDNFKFIFRPGSDTVELYDVILDRGEKTNVAQKHPERAAFYKDRVLVWRAYTIRSLAQFHPPGAIERDIDLTSLPLVFSAQDYGDLAYNETLEHKVFQIGGQEYSCSGFGTHANSILTFDVSGYQGYYFLSRFGRDQVARGGRSGRGKVRAQVWMDGKVVYESPLLRSRNRPVEIVVPITGTRLSLVALDGRDGRHGDHVDWLEPRLVKRGPRQTATQPVSAEHQE
jgi:arylsulfatase A-like enzyme